MGPCALLHFNKAPAHIVRFSCSVNKYNLYRRLPWLQLLWLEIMGGGRFTPDVHIGQHMSADGTSFLCHA